MDPLADPKARALSRGRGAMPTDVVPGLVPELLVSDLDASLRFWCAFLGFRVAFDRPAAGFAYLARERAQVMLCRRNGRWETGPLEKPLGRGINLQIAVERLDPVLDALRTARWPLYEEPAEAWYRAGPCEIGQRECLVQDPDGYLLRLAEGLGQRPISSQSA